MRFLLRYLCARVHKRNDSVVGGQKVRCKDMFRSRISMHVVRPFYADMFDRNILVQAPNTVCRKLFLLVDMDHERWKPCFRLFWRRLCRDDL